MRKGSWLLPVALLLAACGSEDASVRPAANRKPNYFDVKGLLDTQIAELNRRQPAVEKQVRLRNGKIETTRVAKTDWNKELQVFYQADINKPALRGAYSETDSAAGQPDGVKVYKLVAPDAKAPVVSLAVNTPGAVPSTAQELTAIVRQDNALFYSEKRLRLRTQSGALKEYEVQGVQKLIMFDTVYYTVRTRVLD
ncbi:hypothetical protein J0X19_20460 [Hymenobacter sp. BT186]|uniref:Lipoprotein n=1 Tax=Hymenobacter telluris TaxID=2816474 RepID=A0A939EZH4_9BACT|nr:hypothetical protein [Hymenobacter telluris]MBO0360345.1 hypothetical protein [Hymenobacter telluris]MBW3376372.1 hypothetical protein [Hymenobacter norwichensis]